MNDLTNSITGAVKAVIDKHAPIRTASRTKQKQLRKPWITNANYTQINLKKKTVYSRTSIIRTFSVVPILS